MFRDTPDNAASLSGGTTFAHHFATSRPWPILSTASDRTPGPVPDAEVNMRFALAAMLLFPASLFADDKKEDDRKAFQGTWTIVDRKSDTKEPVTAPTVVFEGDKYK